ncbi:MAG: hypothetical protein DRN04_15795 [Thermoprotei archaeon]|nr:MAG: hypothetical protein DRN04_15795 [Thermoprotei archaeon]
MDVTGPKVIWIVLGLAAAAFAAALFYSWIVEMSQRGDFMVLELNAYSDGTVFVTIVNTGTLPITSVTVSGQTATGPLPLQKGETAQYRATVRGLQAGRETTFDVTVTFSNGHTKTIRVRSLVKP